MVTQQQQQEKTGKTNIASSEAIDSFLETMHIYVTEYEWHIRMKEVLDSFDRFYYLFLEACQGPGFEQILDKYIKRTRDAIDELEDVMYQINRRRLRQSNGDASILENEMNEPNNV